MTAALPFIFKLSADRETALIIGTSMIRVNKKTAEGGSDNMK